MSTVQFTATLYLEVRSRGSRPGKSEIENRVYELHYAVDPTQQDPCDLHMMHTYAFGDGLIQSSHTWTADEYDLEARTATFRKSMRASDKLLDKLERFGWRRRHSLEGEAET